ncbi:MAG TPA: hypothetical protein VMD30_13795, partial [Tepidisphaeraceae bacterium]|nr:hypothetical protein [Tepidisphaeraceae bacterium]
KNASIADVAAEISKQTGNIITTQNWGGVRPVTLDVVDQPFWAVLDDACRQAGVLPQSNMPRPNQIGLSLFPDSQYGQDAIYLDHGPIHLHLSQVTHQSFLTFPGKPRDYCTLQLDGLWEPRLNLMCYSTVGVPDTAVDDKGNSLVPPPGSTIGDPRNYYSGAASPDQFLQYPNPAWGNQQISFAVQIAIPPNAGNRIAKISGSFKFWMAENFEPVTVSDTAPPNRNALAFQTLNDGAKVFAWRQQNQVSILIPGDSGSQWSEQPFHRFRLTGKDSAGNIIHFYNSGGGSWSNNVWVGFFNSNNNAGFMNLKVEYADNVKEIDIPYQFANLPLP